MVRYHLFGSSVDCVTTLEQACTPGRIRISEPFARALRPLNPFLGGDARDEPGTSAAGGALRPLYRSSASPGVPGSPVFGPVDVPGFSGVVGGVDGADASHSSLQLPSQRRLLLRGLNAGGAPTRSISLLALTATHTEAQGHSSPEGMRDSESPTASAGHLMDPLAVGASAKASSSHLRLSNLRLGGSQHGGPWSSAGGAAGTPRAEPPAPGLSGARQHRLAAAGAAADSESFNLEPAPSLVLKGLGMCRTFHFADVVPRPPTPFGSPTL